MNRSVNKKVNLLILYAIISSLALIGLLSKSFFIKDTTAQQDELTVKRLNIVGEDGSYRMVFSNEKRQHSGRVAGEDLPPRKRPAGIIFFNNEGDECGGLIAEVDQTEKGKNAYMSFTMDNYHDDQALQIINDEYYEDGTTSIHRGVVLNEYPENSNLMDRYHKLLEADKITDQKQRDLQKQMILDNESAKRRLFIGRGKDKNTGLFLYDQLGKLKMKIFIDAQGNPRMQILDQNGNDKDILSFQK